MKKIAVYTAISGGYDSLKPVWPKWLAEADFIAYMEGGGGAGWTIRPVCSDFVDDCRNAKKHKIVPEDIFDTYEYSIWIDGSIMIKSEQAIGDLIDSLLAEHDFALFSHRRRNCIYEEARECIAAGKDSKEVIERQVAEYARRGHPRSAGLAECTVLVRRHSSTVREFCRSWYREICLFSRRDQISFNVVARDLQLRYVTIPGNIANNPHFLWTHHDYGSGVIAPIVDHFA